jgi:LysR family transcriptional regulator, benzoate and cis,cis-muconate-responsive activator of ben and cat genes
MELRHLRYFVAVGEALSYTRASRRLHLTQPALTRQVRDLETELGVRLLDRTKHRVNLTVEGRSFLKDAKRMLALGDEIVESVRQLSRKEAPALNIGYVADLFYDLLPETLASFQCSCPTTAVNLFDLSCGDQFRALHDGRIDLGFVGLREAVDEAGLEFRSIVSYKTVVALPKKMPLVSQRIIKLKDLEPLFFIAMSETSYPGYRRWLTKTCRRVGFNPRVLEDVEIERTVIRSVAAGLGVALVPDQVKKIPHNDVVFRPVAPTIMTESCIAWKADNPSPAMRACIDIVTRLGTSMR